MAKSKLSINARFEYLRAMQEHYQVADRKTKSKLLDQMGTITQLGRKHLIAQMNNPDLRRCRRSRERQRVYDDEVSEAVGVVADALDWICAERLQPTLRKTAEILISFGEMEATSIVLDKLQRISISTVERILKRIRPKGQLPRAYPGRRKENEAQQAVPISLIPWDESEPGHFEIDLVHHGTVDQDGKLVCTIQFIAVLTGWSERFAIMGYTFDAIWRAIQTFRQHCPLPIRELHSDNGSEFINGPLIAAFGRELVGVAQTRGRPGYHNDNRFIEQKNSSLVRAYLGDLPLHTYQQMRALGALYEDMWLYYNFFQPVLRQRERIAVTGTDGIVRIRRKQDRACTPFERLLTAKPPISKETRIQLQALVQRTNPLALKRRIHAKLNELTELACSGMIIF